MHGDTGLRSAKEVELAALSCAEVKALASGNPMVLEKAGVDAELAKLAVLKSQWDQQQWANRQEIASLPGKITWKEERIEAYCTDIASRVDTSGTRFSIEIEGSVYTDRELASIVPLRNRLEQSRHLLAVLLGRPPRQYRFGVVTYLQLLIAQQQAQQARIGLLAAQARRLADTAAFYQAMGGGSP